MPKKASKKSGNFAFRVKIGECEVEINGTREEVLKAIEDLPNLMGNVQKAFEVAKPKTVTTLTVKTGSAKEETHAQKGEYPKIAATESNDVAILGVLESEWGKWRPRTVEELKEALKANGLDYSGRSLAKILMELVQRGTVRRWSTDAGFVYILAEKETLSPRGEAK